MDTCTEGGRKMGTSQLHARQKKGHMTNIYLMDLDEEAIVDFVKDHNELYDNTNEHFKDKASHKLFRQGVQDMVCVAKDMLQQAHALKVWAGPK